MIFNLRKHIIFKATILNILSIVHYYYTLFYIILKEKRPKTYVLSHLFLIMLQIQIHNLR